MNQTKKSITIGNAGGYWGDDPKALQRQLEGNPLNYISIDFLAEITMSILQKQRSRDSNFGYARDFITMLEPVLGTLLERKTCVITNAGGVNPEGCAEAIVKLCQKLGLKIRVGLVEGDDILERLDTLQADGHPLVNMETKESFATVKDRIQAANIYFGARPVVEALRDQPDIIVTGRVTDTGITLAPMIHEFNWSLTDWDKLASGIVAGHLLECGSQSTGGNFTDWRKIKTWDHMGYPFVEVFPDSSFVLSKHSGTGGMVSVDTCREQLFYEMGHPNVYLTPDVVADFGTIKLEPAGADKVKVSGVRGFEPTPFYKVSMAYADGMKAQGSILISGPEAAAKAQLFASIFWKRCEELNLSERYTEFVGWNACHRSLGHSDDGNEVILKLSARSESESDLRAFSKLVPSLILGGPPGVAVLGGVPKSQEVVSYWPALIAKEAAKPLVRVVSIEGSSKVRATEPTFGKFEPNDASAHTQVAHSPTADVEESLRGYYDPQAVPIFRVALARSGDKGDTCNIGVLARSAEAYEFLKSELTAQRVKNWFQELCLGPVTRYEVPNMLGFNFLLEASLGGGGTKTLRSDAQGKTFGQAVLRQRLPIPKKVLDSISEESR